MKRYCYLFVEIFISVVFKMFFNALSGTNLQFHLHCVWVVAQLSAHRTETNCRAVCFFENTIQSSKEEI